MNRGISMNRHSRRFHWNWARISSCQAASRADDSAMKSRISRSNSVASSSFGVLLQGTTHSTAAGEGREMRQIRMAVPLHCPCPAAYHGGMDERNANSLSSIEILYLSAGAFIVLSPLIAITAILSGDEMFIFTVAGFFAGSTVVFSFVRWLNRRDDTRRAKRPPNPP